MQTLPTRLALTLVAVAATIGMSAIQLTYASSSSPYWERRSSGELWYDAGNSNVGPWVTVQGGGSVFENVALRLYDAGGGNANNNILEFAHRVGDSPVGLARVRSENVGNQSANGANLILESAKNSAGALNSNQLFLSNTGRVGIATNDPQTQLDVRSESRQLSLTSFNTRAEFNQFSGGDGTDSFLDLNLIPQDNSSNARIRLFRATNTSGSVGMYILNGDGSTTANAYLAGQGNSYLAANNGNVGIGTDSPKALLHLKADHSAWDKHIWLEDHESTDVGAILLDGQGMKFRTMANEDNFYFRDDQNNTNLIIKDGGEVGIGTIDPYRSLEVNGNGLRLRGSAQTYTDFIPFNGGDGSDGFLDLNVVPQDNSSNARIRLFRATNTSGAVGMYILKGDDSATANAYLAGNGDTFFAANNGNVGIGTTNPSEKLTVTGNIKASGQICDKNGCIGGLGADVLTSGKDIIFSGEKNIKNADQIIGYNDLRLSGNASGGVDLSITPNGDILWGSKAALTKDQGGSIELGGSGMAYSDFKNNDTDFDARLMLVDDNTLHLQGARFKAGEIIVEGGWADYVFEEDYPLMSLEDLAAFVEANNHLPNVPTAAEIEAEGINMAETQAKLLEKIEELTLYTLEQEAALQDANARIERLEQLIQD